MERITWDEFADMGMFWFINRTLHLFGLVLVRETNENKTIEVYPAKTKFRGFTEESEEKGFKKVTDYLKENIKKIYEDCNDI